MNSFYVIMNSFDVFINSSYAGADFSHEIPQKCSRLPPLGVIFFILPPYLKSWIRPWYVFINSLYLLINSFYMFINLFINSVDVFILLVYYNKKIIYSIIEECYLVSFVSIQHYYILCPFHLLHFPCLDSSSKHNGSHLCM